MKTCDQYLRVCVQALDIFILVKTRKLSDGFEKSPYILLGQHSGNAQKHLINIFMCVANHSKKHSFILIKTGKMSGEFQKSLNILLGEYSGNARKHLVNIFTCVQAFKNAQLHLGGEMYC